MPKEYILLNFDTGEFDLGYDPKYVLSIMEQKIKEGIDIQDMSIYLADRTDIIETVRTVSEYKIKD